MGVAVYRFLAAGTWVLEHLKCHFMKLLIVFAIPRFVKPEKILARLLVKMTKIHYHFILSEMIFEKLVTTSDDETLYYP